MRDASDGYSHGHGDGCDEDSILGEQALSVAARLRGLERAYAALDGLLIQEREDRARETEALRRRIAQLERITLSSYEQSLLAAVKPAG